MILCCKKKKNINTVIQLTSNLSICVMSLHLNDLKRQESSCAATPKKKRVRNMMELNERREAVFLPLPLFKAVAHLLIRADVPLKSCRIGRRERKQGFKTA